MDLTVRVSGPSGPKYTATFTTLALIWMLVIFMFSAKPGIESNELSLRFVAIVRSIVGVLNSIGFNISIDDVDLGLLNFIVRKAAHATEYAVLGFLLSGSTVIGAVKKKKAPLVAFIIGVLYACSDELHQFFVPGRQCAFRDVCIDSAGVFVGVLFFSGCLYVFSRWVAKEK